ncbi:MAG: tryptophan synthase subunit alpha, partial [Flavobacteriaceae bacterium]
MNRIDQKFKGDKKLLSIYFSAGYPKLEDTVPILKQLQSSGVDMVEIGLPFSDPLADGPTIQESSTQALRNGMSTKKLFQQLEGIRKEIEIPLIIMGYFNPLLQFGVENFCKKCHEIGIDGLIIPDLPVEVYHEKYKTLFDQYGLYNMFLITPQTSESRIRFIDQVSNGFIYMVSSASVTGAKNTFGQTQKAYFKRIQNMNLKTPTVVGFGISNAETFTDATYASRGAIIGSAFIKFLATEGIDQIP